jgi:hypothetical protein
LHITQHTVKRFVAFFANDLRSLEKVGLHMGRPAKIHQHKAPIRLHYIAEWAERRQHSQADLEAAFPKKVA